MVHIDGQRGVMPLPGCGFAAYVVKVMPILQERLRRERL